MGGGVAAQHHMLCPACRVRRKTRPGGPGVWPPRRDADNVGDGVAHAQPPVTVPDARSLSEAKGFFLGSLSSFVVSDVLIAGGSAHGTAEGR